MVLARDRDGLHLHRCGLGVTDLVDGLRQLPWQGPLSPDPHRVRDAATADEYLEILPEDAPVAHGHLGHGLVGPMDLVFVLGLDVALLEADWLLRRLDECGDVLARVLCALCNQLFVEAVVLTLLADVDPSPVTPPEEQLRLDALRVQRVVVTAHRVVVRVPLEVEDVPEFLGRLLHLLLGVLHSEVMPLDQLELFLGLTLAPLVFGQLEEAHLREGTHLDEVGLLFALLQSLLLALLALALPLFLAAFPLALS